MDETTQHSSHDQHFTGTYCLFSLFRVIVRSIDTSLLMIAIYIYVNKFPQKKSIEKRGGGGEKRAVRSMGKLFLLLIVLLLCCAGDI
jgi:hypothetical protein